MKEESLQEKRKEIVRSAGVAQVYWPWARLLLTVLIIVGLGIFCVNQYLEYRYHVQLLATPCQLCAELNQERAKCVNGCFIQKENLYPDGNGGWMFQNGTPYNGYTGQKSFDYNILGNVSLNFSQ